MEFTIDGDEGLTLELIDQFKAELVTLVEKYGLRVRTNGGAQRHRAKQSSDGHDETARLDRIFSTPVLNRVISGEDFAELPAESRGDLDRELLECYERHRAAWTIPPDDGSEEWIRQWFEKTEARPSAMHDFSREVLQIGAKHGVPRAIAALKGEMSPELKKATKLAKVLLEKKRRGRAE